MGALNFLLLVLYIAAVSQICAARASGNQIRVKRNILSKVASKMGKIASKVETIYSPVKNGLGDLAQFAGNAGVPYAGLAATVIKHGGTAIDIGTKFAKGFDSLINGAGASNTGDSSSSGNNAGGGTGPGGGSGVGGSDSGKDQPKPAEKEAPFLTFENQDMLKSELTDRQINELRSAVINIGETLKKLHVETEFIIVQMKDEMTKFSYSEQISDRMHNLMKKIGNFLATLDPGLYDDVKDECGEAPQDLFQKMRTLLDQGILEAVMRDEKHKNHTGIYKSFLKRQHHYSRFLVIATGVCSRIRKGRHLSGPQAEVLAKDFDQTHEAIMKSNARALLDELKIKISDEKVAFILANNMISVPVIRGARYKHYFFTHTVRPTAYDKQKGVIEISTEMRREILHLYIFSHDAVRFDCDVNGGATPDQKTCTYIEDRPIHYATIVADYLAAKCAGRSVFGIARELVLVNQGDKTKDVPNVGTVYTRQYSSLYEGVKLLPGILASALKQFPKIEKQEFKICNETVTGLIY